MLLKAEQLRSAVGLDESVDCREERVEAKVSVQRLLELYPEDAEQGGAIALQALVARELEDRQSELEALSKLVKLSSDNVPALLRLIQLHRECEAWQQVREVAGQLLAVQPLITTGHEAWIEAVEKLGTPSQAIHSLRLSSNSSLSIQPPFIIGLAKCLFDRGPIR